MVESAPVRSNPPLGMLFAMLAAGVLLLAAGWLFPVSLKSVNPLLLEEAGRNTPLLSDFGLQLVQEGKPGAAQLVLDAAIAAKDRGAGELTGALGESAKANPDLALWGGKASPLDAVLKLQNESRPAGFQPVLPQILPEQNRQALIEYLAMTRAPGALALLRTREQTPARFIPADKPGGQPLEATIVLAALLHHGGHLSPGLSGEIRKLTDEANQSGALGALEAYYLDLLALGQRLNWGQLCELVRHAPDTAALAGISRSIAADSERLPTIYSAALFSQAPDQLAAYLSKFGKEAGADVASAMAMGQGALRELLREQKPVRAIAGTAPGFFSTAGLAYPTTALAFKYLGILLGGFCLIGSLTQLRLAALAGVNADTRLGWLKASVAAVLVFMLLVALSEPVLFEKTASTERSLQLVIPALEAKAPAPADKPTNPASLMDISTLFSILVFLLLQIFVYVVCLMRISDIDRQETSPLLKLRLMENEENLFDAGLYVGIGGTAAALVLQVVGVIEANLLAAYSSNLLGIICVALVKIRHVRPYKRKLILAGQI